MEMGKIFQDIKYLSMIYPEDCRTRIVQDLLQRDPGLKDK
jgi:hypothetical protein